MRNCFLREYERPKRSSTLTGKEDEQALYELELEYARAAP